MAPPPKKPAPEIPAAEEEGPATFYVRMGPDGEPLSPDQLEAPPPPPTKAPKKGLQVQIPDDDGDAPPPPPAPKRKPPPAPTKAKVAAPAPTIAAAAGKKGRRGNWWDAKGDKDEQEEVTDPASSADDEAEHDGATAFLKVEKAPAEPPEEKTAMFKPGRKGVMSKADLAQADDGEHDGATAIANTDDLQERKPAADDAEPPVEAPKKKRKAEPEEYKPVAAPDYQGDVGRRSPVARFIARLIVLSAVAAVLGTIALVGLYFYLSQTLPRLESLDDYKPLVSTHVVAADGTVIGEFYKERRTVVPLSKVPQALKDAVLSAEDKDFYKHHGVSVLGLARAAIVDILSGKKRQGASTITQQVVKTFFLSKEKKFSRKVKEIVLAFKVEKDLSKDDILSLYLNQINFGKAHYGVEEASLYYFGKHVEDLELGEASLIAGIPQNPGRLNPRFHPTRAKNRQTYVLGRMLANKKITQEQHDREVEKPIALPPAVQDAPGAWYLEEVKRRLIEQYGEAAINSAGMTVEVAMVPAMQRAAERAVQEGLRAVDKRQGWRGAEFKVGDSLEEVRTALQRRYAAMAPTPGAVMVFDLGGIPEAEQGLPSRIANAARMRVLEPGGIYAGLVTKVQHNGIDVELAPDVVGWVPFSSMAWARPFKPSSATPAPATPAEVARKGDVVEVSVTRLVLKRTSAIHLRGRELELALEQTPLVQGAFAAIDVKTRALVALVGGYDFALSQFNRATQAKRQPGSAFKPILYAAAIETGKYTPATRVLDTPTPIEDPWTHKVWNPQNFERDTFEGPISLRRALATSKNTVAVKLLLDVGFDKVRSMATAAGLTTEVPRSYTAALGTGEVIPIELINSYATLASLGRKGEPMVIRKVLSRTNSVMANTELVLEPSIKPEVAYITSEMMRSVIDDPEGTARSLMVLQRPIAGKTGTASEHRDGWFVGFTPSLVAGAWVGFDDHQVLGPLETGGHCAGPIWLRFMKSALAGTAVEEWPAPPPGVSVAKVNRNTGALSTDPNDPYAQREVFLAGTEPTSAAATADQTQFLKEQ